MSNPDCIVVGGGAIGLMSAHFLVERGRKVLLLEKGALARESSWAGGGIVSPMYPWRYPDAVNRLAIYGQRHYPEVVARLRDETGIDPELLPSGMLMLDAPEPGMWEWAEKWSMKIERLTSREALDAVQPGLDARFDSGLWMPEIHQVRNPRLAKALAARARRTVGLTIREHAPVVELLREGDRIRGVRLDSGETIAAECVLITAGAWTGGLMPRDCPAPAKIEPVKGQIVQFRAEPSQLARMVMRDSRYLIPRKDGLILIGSTLEPGSFDKQTTVAALEDLKASAIALFPALASCPVVNQWAGLRPGTADGVPFIGPCPAVEGLFVNAGQFRNGIVMGLGSALLVAQLMAGEQPFVDPAPYVLA